MTPQPAMCFRFLAKAGLVMSHGAFQKVAAALVALCLATMATAGAASEKTVWDAIAPGLEYATFRGGSGLQKESGGELNVLRISPDQVSFKLLTASEKNLDGLALRDWVRQFDLDAAINASMFWKDQRTSTGFMKNFEHVNNQAIHPDFGAFFVFNPKSPDLKPVRLIDRTKEPNWRTIISRYHSVVQNYRMIGADGESVWQPSEETYSVAAIAMDRQDRVLFIFRQAPQSIHRLNQVLLELPLNLVSCMFVEGGPTAGMYIQTKRFEQGWRGVSDNSFWVEKPGTLFKVPNVIGVQARP
jgi:hypothetical protein